MKRVVYTGKNRESGMVEAWHEPIDEAHFGEMNLNQSRMNRELPLQGKVVITEQLEWYRGLARLFI